MNAVVSWTGDGTTWPNSSFEQGVVRISGTVTAGASWHVARDRLGWTTVVLLGQGEAARGPRIRARADDVISSSHLDPIRVARAIGDQLEPGMDRAELGVLRIGPHGRLVELVNASLPALIHWDPHHGIAPYEPIGRDPRSIPVGATTELVRLAPGAILIAATSGLLAHDASWQDLGRFVRAIGVDMLGGLIADAPPPELARLLRQSWPTSAGPSGMVLAGVGRPMMAVA